MTRYVISDTHFYHANIIKYCNRPENCDELMVENWRKIVKPEDIVYHLGDVIFGKKSCLKDILDGLPGKKILIRGNHDIKSNTWYTKNGFDFVCDGLIHKNILLTHKPMVIPTFNMCNIHGHLHNLGYSDVVSFQESYKQFDDGMHVLYSPENEGYKPVELYKLASRVRV